MILLLCLVFVLDGFLWFWLASSMPKDKKTGSAVAISMFVLHVICIPALYHVISQTQ